jgi:phenylacetate-coenzyme A ligase PaaK-like adenylate-forming protein
LFKVRGRTDDTFWVYDREHNPVALPPIPFEALFLDVDGLGQYQLVQEERDRLHILFKPRSGVDTAVLGQELCGRLKSYLEQKGLGDIVRVGAEAVEQIERHATSGKIRQIYSKVERLYLPGKALGERRAGDERRLLDKSAIPQDRRQQSRRVEDKNPGEGP